MYVLLGTLSSNDATATRRSKMMVFNNNMIVHHTFLYISSRFLHDYDVKMLNFAFYGEIEQETTKLINFRPTKCLWRQCYEKKKVCFMKGNQNLHFITREKIYRALSLSLPVENTILL